jgi:Queuine tRNA-ribosyltransferase
MGKQLLVLGCSQVKRESQGFLPAIDRYDGSSYRVLRSYLREYKWPSNLSVAILSARYGLVGGFTGIEDYDERMTPIKALELAPTCEAVLEKWKKEHSSIHFSLGKDYLPAIKPAIDNGLNVKTEIFDGPIGMKLKQIRDFLYKTESPRRDSPTLPKAGSGAVRYFLPDWDDLLDGNFNFDTDSFSGTSPQMRGDRHCSVLMKPNRIFDGVLVSLAQHVTLNGKLRRILGTESQSLAPRDLRLQFCLDSGQSLFGDCGAFTYVNEPVPTITVEQANSLYDLNGFDFGASVDHIPVKKIIRDGVVVELTEKERRERVLLTVENAKQFIDYANKRGSSFIPVGTIQALNPEEYVKNLKIYHSAGYRYLAIGGLVPLSDAAIQEIVVKVMKAATKLNPRPWIHLFGIFRPKLQKLFRTLGVDSFDSATYFRKAWLRSDQNYLGSNGAWYAAIRVPMTNDPRTRKRLEAAEFDITKLEQQEKAVLKLLHQYDCDNVSANEVLDAVIA